MPAEARQKYESAMQQIDKDHNGMPDFLEGDSTFGMDLPRAADDTSYAPSRAIAPVSGQSPVIAPEQNSNRLLIVAGAIIVLLLLAILGLVLYVFFH